MNREEQKKRAEETNRRIAEILDKHPEWEALPDEERNKKIQAELDRSK